MANIDQTEAGALLAASLRGTAYTAPSAWYLALDTTTTAPTATGLGSEVSGGSYARQTIAFGAVSAGATSAPAVTYSSMPVATVGSVEIFTAATGTTRRLWYGNLSANKTTAAGDTLTVTVSASLG